MGRTRSRSFGEMLQRYRLTAGLTQEELAERARLSARAISDLERGVKTRPHLATVRQLADAFGLSEQERSELQLAARGQTPAPQGGDRAPEAAPDVHTFLTVVSPHASLLLTEEPAPERMQQLPVGGFLGSLPSGALVAREEELVRILSAVERVASSEGRLVLLAGEPGIGKTRLAQEITRAVYDCGFVIAAGRCYEPQQSVPYYPFLDALTMAYTAAPGAIQDQAAHRWPYLARLLPDQLGSATAVASEGSEEQERLFWAVSAFLLAIAKVRPVALLLDDLHWADSASLQLLQHLARQTRGSRTLLLGTYRDVEVRREHPLEATLRDLSREQLEERVVLRRLQEKDTAAFIMETVSQLEAGAEFAALVHRHTDGNPFFTRQVLQALIENGSLYRQDGQWKRRAMHEIEVPETVRSVIAQRVARLRPEAQEVLQEASVLGPAFSFDDLLAMKSPSQDADLGDALDAALTDAASLRLVRVTSKDQYAFDHALTQQALYAALPPRRRRRLHLAAGEALESLPEPGRSRRAAELAWHFVEGGNQQRAFLYSLLAGEQAEAVFANREAEQQYRACLRLAREAGNEPGEAAALENLGRVLRVIGRYDEALGVLTEAARLYHRLGNVDGEARSLAQVGWVHTETGVLDEDIDRLVPIARSLEGKGSPDSLASLYVTLAHLLYRSGRYEELLDAAERAAALAAEAQNEWLLAEADHRRCIGLRKLGRRDEMQRVLASLGPLAERSGNLRILGIALNLESYEHQIAGRFERFGDNLEKALATAERVGDPSHTTFLLFRLGWQRWFIGDWREARQLAERGLALSRSSRATWVSAYPLFLSGMISLSEGKLEDAARYLEEALAISAPNRDLQCVRHVSGLLAEIDLLRGRPQAGLARLEPLLDRPGLDEEDVNWILPVLARTHWALGNEAEAQALVDRGLKRALAEGNRVVETQMLQIQAIVLAGRGRWQEAERVFEMAATMAREMPFPYEEARTLYEYGLAAAARGDQNRACSWLHEALVIFRRLGAETYRARADQAIGALSRRSDS